MRYYTNLELAKRFGVSANTIGYWIEDSVLGKNELEVVQTKQKTTDKVVYKIVSNQRNLEELQRLYSKGRKNQNTLNYKKINLTHNDINIFTEEEISEIINSIDEGCVPLKFSYMSGGAVEWDEFVNEGYKANTYPTTKRTEQLLRAMLQNIKLLNPLNKKINIFDVGCGNFLPVSKLLNELEMDGTLNKYIGIDISKELLSIAKINALKVIPEHKIVMTQRDFESANLLYYSNFYKEDNTINIFLFLGGTLGNYVDNSVVLKHLRDSMMVDDLLLLTCRNDVESTIDIFNSISEKNERILWIPQLFGFDTDDCVLTTWYNHEKKVKYLGIEIKKDYSIKYTYESGSTKNIEIKSGQKLILVFYKINSVESIICKLGELGLKMKQYITTETGETGLIIFTRKPLKDRL